MPLLKQLRTLFGAHFGTPAPEVEGFRVVNEIFTYLQSLVKTTDLIATPFAHFKHARSLENESRASTALHAYFEIEQYIVSNHPPAVEALYTVPTLRARIRERFDVASLPDVFKLVFLPEDAQIREVYLIGTQNLLRYLAERAGVERARNLLVRAIPDALPKDVVTGIGIDMDTLRQTASSEQTSTVLKRYKTLYKMLFDDIKELFGEKRATDLCRDEYQFFKTTYDVGLTSQFLSLLPDGILDLERLAYMSREELERKITERTEELHELNEQLEKKVSERTKELKQKVEELDASNERLKARDVELTAANEHLTEIDTAKTEFISVAAHQLRTPLAGQRWMFSLLIEEDSSNLTPRQKDLLGKGYENTKRMINLINDMLVVTHIESGRMRYTFSSIHIEDVIDSALPDFTGQVLARKIALTFERPVEPLPLVNADPEKIRSVIQNLVENAVNYSHDGGTITLSARSENDFVTVFIKDNGIGIPAKQRSGIFDKFFRADNAVRMWTDGSGLGLYVARRIVEKHGGSIGFESAEGVGTTFHFTIPIKKVEALGRNK